MDHPSRARNHGNRARARVVDRPSLPPTIGMSLRAKVIIFGALLAAILVWLLFFDGGTRGDDANPNFSTRAAPRAAGGEAESAHAASAPIREANAAPKAKPTEFAAPRVDGARLLLHVRWDDDGTPAPGQKVLLETKPNDRLALPVEVTSGADGDCVYVASEGGAVVATTHDLGDRTATATMKVGETVEATIRLDRGYKVSVMVVDPAGRGVADAEVWIVNPEAVSRGAGGADPNETRPGGILAGRSGPDGAFALDRASGHQCLTAYKDGYGLANGDSRPVWVLQQVQESKKPNPESRPGFPKNGLSRGEAEVRLVLREAPHTIVGTVLDVNSVAIAGASVRCLCRGVAPLLKDRSDGKTFATYAVTDSLGRFRAVGLPGTECELWVRADPWVSATRTIPLGKDPRVDVEIRLERGVTVAGALLDPDGRPAPRIRLEVSPVDYAPQGDEVTYLLPHTESDANGNYRLSGIAPGAFRIVAWGHIAGGKELQAEVDLTGESMQEIAWNPTLAIRK
jgi:hypothetical protein